MRGIFQKENANKARKYGIYRHLPTYEKIIRNLVSFYESRISKNDKMKMQKNLLANLISMYNTIIKNKTEKNNIIFMKQTKNLVKRYAYEWIGNRSISATRKGAYILLAYMPGVYNLIVKYA